MKSRNILLLLLVMVVAVINLISCSAKFGQVVISKPDEYRQTYEAREKVVLEATARVFKDKNMGSNVRIDRENRRVESDYITAGEWRTHGTAKVKKLNWKECELTISLITEKRTETGWEMRRLLEKEQYINLFDIIDLQIYEDMSKIE